MALNKSPEQEPHAVWVFGKVCPGWYMAKGLWDRKYADHLESLGYKVDRSIKKPVAA